MTAEAALQRGPGDVIGLDLAVRFRVETSDRPFMILVPSDPVSLHPLGYNLEYESDQPLWLTHTVSGGKASRSPGLKVISRATDTEWLIIPAFSAIEWEDITTSSTATRARTVFLRSAPSGDVVEVASSTY